MFQLIPCRAVSHQYEVRTLCRGLQGQQAQQFGVGFFRCQPSHRNEKKLFRLQFKLGAQGDTRGVFGRGTKAEKTDVLRSIQFLTLLLNKHYNKKVILLIDEYDVPVAKANSNGYYDKMLDVMKGLMIPSMPALQSLRQSTRKPWKIWRVSAKRLCSKLMIGCTQKSTRMAMIRFFATAFRSSKNAAW